MRPKPFLASLAQGRVVDKDARMYISKLLIFCFALLYTSWSVRIMARMIQIDKITAKGASMHCSHVFFYLICGVSRCSTHLGTRAAGRKHGQRGFRSMFLVFRTLFYVISHKAHVLLLVLCFCMHIFFCLSLRLGP